ncbi:MAG: response regulator [Nitrolancea sp.]
MPKIAVINDDTAFLQLMLDLLSDVGYDVLLHKEGAAAHTQLREEEPDLIILDVRLEQPDAGWMVLEMIRLDPATTKIPVIVCSADTIQLESKRELLNDLRCQTLEKPFDLDTLIAMVTKTVGPPERPR